jgi:predicted phosphodiesterase
MRIAIISDIHGECFLLDHVLEDIERHKVDQIVCLGDAIQGGSQPAETVARLRELKCPVVMGNADAWLVSFGASKEENISEKQLAVRSWSLRQLSEDDIEFIRNFKPTLQIDLEGGKKLLCFHGSPNSFDDIILPATPDPEVKKFFSGFEAAFFAGGHTHLQQIRRIGNSWFVNPGSVSVVYNRELSGTDAVLLDPWSEYAILSSEAQDTGVTFRALPFDVAELAKVVRKTGRPNTEEMLAQYLARH